MTTIQKAHDVVARTNQDGSLVLMKMDESNLFYKINGVAALVWKELHEGKSVEAVIEMIVADYDTTIEQARQDVEDLVQELIQKKLIHSH